MSQHQQSKGFLNIYSRFKVKLICEVHIIVSPAINRDLVQVRISKEPKK